MSSVSWTASRGVAAFFTPCLVLAATLATISKQLELPVGGASFTVFLYLLLDFLAFRLGRRTPFLRRLRVPFSVPYELWATAAVEDKEGKHEGPPSSSVAPVARRAQRGATTSTPISAPVSMPVVERPSAVGAGAGVSATAASAGAESTALCKGLRLSMLGENIRVNAETPFEFENDFFKGRMLFLLDSTPPNPKYAAHFEGKNRTFEMQIQGKLKLLPKGEVYMGGELEERPKQGLVTQTVSKIVMSFASKVVKSLHYSFGQRRPPPDPLDGERAHVTFPLYRVMDWFVVTPEVEEPPALGGDIAESPEDQAARRGGKTPDITWQTDVIYTMCFHSNTVNFQDWAVINVPGQGSLDLNTFLCKQPVSVVVYDFTAASSSAAHKARDKSYMFQCTISNDCPGHIAGDLVPLGDIATSASAIVHPATSVTETGATAAAGDGSEATGAPGLDGEYSDDVGTSGRRGIRKRVAAHFRAGSSDEETDQDGRSSPMGPIASDTAEGNAGVSSARRLSASSPSLRKSLSVASFASPSEKEAKGLVKSGDVLPLLMGGDNVKASPPNAGHGQVAFLGEGYGGRVVMRRGVAMPAGVQVVKVGGGVGTFRSDHFYEDDVIVLHHPESRKFMSIGRAWALGWSSKASASKIHFIIKGLEAGRPLAHGQAFSLNARKWSDWEVGVSRQASTKLGGRGLGCINKVKRRNISRYSVLTLVARPWFDPAADLEGGGVGGVIPALEAEAYAMTIAVRGPFEDGASAEEEDEDDDDMDGSDVLRANNDESDVEDGMSDSDPEYDSDVDKSEMDRGNKAHLSFSGNGISAKAARVMACYPDNMSSLKVGVPAWVEFLNRGRRQGQLAFVVAVQPVRHPSTTADGSTMDSSTSSSINPDRVEDAGTATSSPAKSKPAQGWTCLRTGRELSGVVQAFRENVVAATAAGGSWESRARPRVIRHMGTADQSVRLINHEISEIQRWESCFRDRDGVNSPPGAGTAAQSPAQPLTSDKHALSDTAEGDGEGTKSKIGSRLDLAALARSSPEKRASSGDGGLSSPPRLQRSPRHLSKSRSFSDPASPTTSSKQPGDSSIATSSSADTSQSGKGDEARRGRPSGVRPGVDGSERKGGGGGEGTTAPYRLLCNAITSPRELDHHFLSGSTAAELGVMVGWTTAAPVLGSAVARCLWESHWREEWAVLFPSHVACYPPLSKKPIWVLPLRTLLKASALPDERCPFPGLRCLRLETLGRAHYLCFASRTSRDNWLSEISRLSKGSIIDSPSGLELGHDPRETYVLKTRWRMPPRLVLNARRPGFDMPEGLPGQGGRLGESGDQQQQREILQQEAHLKPWELSAEVLRCAYRVHADPTNKRLVPFLDLASTFRHVDLSSLDLDSEEALCFFANLYHLLIRHMLLVLGPPASAKEWPSSFSQVSYEVGGDVFSLQELEHCVLRGKFPRPSLKDLPKRFAPLPPEGDDHYAYALSKVDSRIGLFLNNGSQSNPPIVVLLTPEMIDEQLNRACQAFVDHTVKVDAKKRQIRVHKAYQLYARDLQAQATSKDMIRYGLRFAGRAVIHALSALDVDISQAQIKYHPYLLKCHQTMTLVDLSASVDDSASSSARGT